MEMRKRKRARHRRLPSVQRRSAREVLECVDGMLEEGGIFILGYVSRWWYVDEGASRGVDGWRVVY